MSKHDSNEFCGLREQEELRDFLTKDVGDQLITAWERGRPSLEDWLSQYERDHSDDRFCATLVRCLTECILVGNPSYDHARELIELAGSDPGRRGDAQYLFGRIHWSLQHDNLVSDAVHALIEAAQVRDELIDGPRAIRALLYLVQFAAQWPGETPQRFSERPDALLTRAETLAQACGRTDLETLVTDHVISYGLRNRNERAIEEMFKKYGKWGVSNTQQYLRDKNWLG